MICNITERRGRHTALVRPNSVHGVYAHDLVPPFLYRELVLPVADGDVCYNSAQTFGIKLPTLDNVFRAGRALC